MSTMYTHLPLPPPPCPCTAAVPEEAPRQEEDPSKEEIVLEDWVN